LARILLAVIEGTGELIRTVLEPRHAVTVVNTIRAAHKWLVSQFFDVIVCDVSFDESQMFDLWTLVRKSGHDVIFLAYRERDSELGESMELIVKKAVFDMGLDGYLDLREFASGDFDNTMLVEFIELGLKAKKRRQIGGAKGRRLITALGTAVNTRRVKLGMSVEELAKASGLKSKVLRNLESGTECDLEINELWKLSVALDVRPFTLLEQE